MSSITVVELNNITNLPPVQNLVKVLLSSGYKVNLIGNHLENLSENIRSHPDFCEYNLSLSVGGYERRIVKKPFLMRQIDKMRLKNAAKKYINICMKDSDFLWTTSMETSVILGKEVLKYKNIMQLLELTECARAMHNLIKIPLDGLALRSWKVVTVEINRAYIQKVWWDLPQTPFVLPNKPFDLDYGKLTPELENAIIRMKAEKKKIVFYLGVIGVDREFIKIANGIKKMGDYALYYAGAIPSRDGDRIVNILEEEYGGTYLGMFNPPKHLALLEYAHIGILPYKPYKKKRLAYSELNALYCAPNKIWEYAGFGVPMVGSDVLGLKLPFEQWNIGRCCDLNDESAIINAIKEVDRNHDEMSKNCYKFYDSVDLEKIVSEILEDEN